MTAPRKGHLVRGRKNIPLSLSPAIPDPAPVSHSWGWAGVSLVGRTPQEPPDLGAGDPRDISLLTQAVNFFLLWFRSTLDLINYRGVWKSLLVRAVRN